MFSGTTVHELFPTPIWAVDLKPDFAASFNRRLLADLDRMTAPRPPMRLGESWQTDTDMHTRPEFAELTSILRGAVRGALDFLQIEYGDFAITGCWANFNPQGSMNTAHTHPNNYLSGVYYVQIPDGANAIEFTDPRPAAVALLPKTRQYNKFNGNRITMQVHPGRLILFPAWLLHGVPVNRQEQERVSIAFNAMFTAFGETMSGTLWRGTLPFRRDGEAS